MIEITAPGRPEAVRRRRCSLRRALVAMGIAVGAVLGGTLAAAPPESPRFPVPVRAWFQPQLLDTRPELYRGMKTFDLAIIEGYTFIPDVGGLTLDGIRARIAAVERAGLLDRAIVCFGYVAAGADKEGRRMTEDDLARLVRAIHAEYPQMPGVAFYGHADGDPATPDLIATAERLGLECHPSRAKPAEEAAGEPDETTRR